MYIMKNKAQRDLSSWMKASNNISGQQIIYQLQVSSVNNRIQNLVSYVNINCSKLISSSYHNIAQIKKLTIPPYNTHTITDFK